MVIHTTMHTGYLSYLSYLFHCSLLYTLDISNIFQFSTHVTAIRVLWMAQVLQWFELIKGEGGLQCHKWKVQCLYTTTHHNHIQFVSSPFKHGYFSIWTKFNMATFRNYSSPKLILMSSSLSFGCLFQVHFLSNHLSFLYFLFISMLDLNRRLW